jgi:fructose-bisphosphate aldolase class II
VKSLLEAINDVSRSGRAIGHFNFAETTVLRAALEAAKNLNVPIILGTSESERDFIGVKQAAALIESYRNDGLNVFLNADHTKSLEKIKEAVEANYDAVLFDGSKLSLAENIRQTKEVVVYVKSINPNIIVEGELGYIGTNSKLLDEIPPGVEKTSVEEAVRFVQETGVDMLAPAVGNIHGMLANAPEPHLDIARIKAIKEAVKIPLVLHGASGNTDADISAAIKAGIAIVHVNTEVRVAWQRALDEYLRNNPQEIAPYKDLASARQAAQEVIRKKLELFSA